MENVIRPLENAEKAGSGLDWIGVDAVVECDATLYRLRETSDSERRDTGHGYRLQMKRRGAWLWHDTACWLWDEAEAVDHLRRCAEKD